MVAEEDDAHAWSSQWFPDVGMRVVVVWLSSLCVLAGSLAAHGQAIHKCRAPEGTAYQSEPCGNGASDTVIAAAGANEKLGLRSAAQTPSLPVRHAPVSSSRRVFWRTSIALGMTDDEVLNLPSW